MRIIIILFLIAFSWSTYAQTSKSLIGAWKVVSMTDDEMYWDMRNDSFSTKEPLTTTDSARTKELVKALLSQMGESLFIFGKNGIYTHKYDGQPDGNGTYSVDIKKSMITIQGHQKNGVSFTEKMKYQFKGNELLLSIEENSSTLQLTLIRQQ
jgi:hypothetical protein